MNAWRAPKFIASSPTANVLASAGSALATVWRSVGVSSPRTSPKRSTEI